MTSGMACPRGCGWRVSRPEGQRTPQSRPPNRDSGGRMHDLMDRESTAVERAAASLVSGGTGRLTVSVENRPPHAHAPPGPPGGAASCSHSDGEPGGVRTLNLVIKSHLL